MKKKLIVLFVLLAATALIAFAVPINKKCGVCGSVMMWTGEMDVEWGKLVFKMKCPANHISWELDEQSKAPNYSNSSNTPSCQYDGSMMYFTGKTKTEWGRLLMEYKCPVGHIVWMTN